MEKNNKFLQQKKIQNIMIYVALFLIVVYPNVMCISDFIYKNSIMIAFTFLIAILDIFILIKDKKSIFKFSIYDCLWFGLTFLVLYNNYDVISNNNYNYIIKLILFLSFIILLKHIEWEKPFLKLFLLLSICHIIISTYMLIDKNFYLENIVPLFKLDTIYLKKIMNQINDGYLLGIASHHSTSGIYFSLGYIASLACTFKDNKVNKKYGLLSIIFLICIFLTHKRGHLIFSIISSFIFIYIYSRKKSNLIKKIESWIINNRKKIVCYILIILFISIGAIALLLQNVVIYEKINKLSSNRLEDLWIPALILFSQHPILGIGWGAYKYQYLDYSNFNIIKNNAHCIYLQLLAETGIVGFILITYLMILTLYKTYLILNNIFKEKYEVDSYQKASIIFSFLTQVFFLLYGFTGNPIYDYAIMLPYMLACGLTYSFLYKEKKYLKTDNNKKFKVAIISAGRQPVPPVKGGAVETGIYQIIKEYDKDSNKEIDLTIYSIYDKKAIEVSKKHDANFVFIKLSKIEEIFNKIVYLINSVFRKLHIKFSITSNIPFIGKVKEDIKFKNFDAILIKNRVDFLLPINKIHDNVIIQLHNDYLNKETYKAKTIIQKASKIVCVSNYIKKRVLDIDKRIANKTIINLNCVDLDIFCSKLSEDRKEELLKQYEINNDKVIIFNGRLNKQKGIKELLLAIERIPKELKIKLLIVGAPWYSSKKADNFTKELNNIASKNIERIIFTGYIPYKDLWEIYAISDLAIVPSMWEEPAGRVVIEAEAAGVPLIVTDSGGMSDYYSSKSAVTVKRDENLIQNLAVQIINLLKNEKKLKQMSEEGKEFVSNLNAKCYYEEFLNFIKEDENKYE